MRSSWARVGAARRAAAARVRTVFIGRLRSVGCVWYSAAGRGAPSDVHTDEGVLLDNDLLRGGGGGRRAQFGSDDADGVGRGGGRCGYGEAVSVGVRGAEADRGGGDTGAGAQHAPADGSGDRGVPEAGGGRGARVGFAGALLWRGGAGDAAD